MNNWHRNHLIRDAICRAIHEAMTARPEVYLLGEGAHMKVHFDAPAIERDFPGRVITLPISEDGNNNFAVGMAIAGLVPIVDVISSDFLFRCMDSIANTMCKQERVSSAKTIVVRSEFFGSGPTSGQRVEDIFRQVPGLRVLIPQSPAVAYWNMRDALERKGITLLFEDRELPDSSFGEAA
ncbi:MAG: hypothetical protein EPO32_14655 [Anaerolineae bacterium]|nr:MAG: hypothetical protein EPO32_14655 [Anaerolineae bacterium]